MTKVAEVATVPFSKVGNPDERVRYPTHSGTLETRRAGEAAAPTGYLPVQDRTEGLESGTRRIHRSCKPQASQGCPYPSHTKHNRHHVVAVVGAGARSIFAGSGKGPWLGAGTLDTARVVREVRTLVTDQWGLRPLAVSLQRHVNWLGSLKEHA